MGQKESYIILKTERQMAMPGYNIYLLVMRLLIILTSVALFFSCNESKDGKTIRTKPAVIDTTKRSMTGITKSSMTDTVKNDILEQINLSVKSGFCDKEDIFDNVEDYLYEIPFDHAWARQQIEKAYSDRLKEQSGWTGLTDFDKLARAFDKLNSSGIISLHNAGITKQDGEDDCEEIYNDLMKKGIKTKGFCYYHWQDIERVVDNGHLYIGFGAFTNNDKDALETGKKNASALESQGFKLDWDKTIESRIEITNITWQKRFGNDNCSNERAIKLLSNYGK